MNKNRIALHIETKKIALVTLLFTIASLLLNLFLIISVNRDCVQMNALLPSDYDYSVTTQEPVCENDYYQFNASIDFAISDDATTSLNVDIVMQSADTQYTDLVYWNADTLSTYGIAVSKNLAKSYGLHLGDKLYSKHIVNGTDCEYTVEQILPEVVNVRASKGKGYSSGIIIMGFDEQYIDNITHSSVVFTKDSIDELSTKYLGTPENIVYRQDEISDILLSITPYLVVFCAFSAAITILLVIMLTKYASHNFRRLIMLGFEKKRLNQSYFRLVYGYGIISIVAVLTLSSSVFLLVELSTVKVVLLMIIPFIELITLSITSVISNKRLWRK
ncbi:MAG: hypothetical protein K2K06_08705 [Oscillospiraceae bacterium]|nr:hypothetical protein [Oscillospiraceae bacterium]